MTITYKDRTHTSRGKAGTTPHTGGGKPHSGATKNRLKKALEAREAKLAARKMNKKTVPLIKAKPGSTKVRPPKYKAPKVPKPKGDETEFEGYMKKTQSKKHGGKISYRMSGGQVVANCYN